MGAEIGQYEEWNHATGLPWDLLNFPYHRQLQAFVAELNRLYKAYPALYQVDFHHSGFEWIDFHDVEGSCIAFIRHGEDPKDSLVVCCNFTPVPRLGYRIGVPESGFYQEILNSDSALFGGGNIGNGGMVSSDPVAQHGRANSLALTLPPLSVLVLQRRVGSGI
jgi:1,4-alpha-glucan branching enzyme